MAILSSGIAMAQNANRHGFFLELGIGGLVGDTPRSSIFTTDNVLKYKYLSGGSADFGLGGRVRFGNHWAYEIKAEAQFPFANPIHSLVGRALPIGFRYTSVEIYRNYSLYTHFNLGGAVTMNRGLCNSDQLLLPNMNEVSLDYVGFGAAYSLGVGVNITTHLYIEAVFNGQVILESYGKNGKGTNNYGMVGCVAGYRF
ncbi:MAG: hypothetical protein K2N35_10230 [Muribaculaceae bacterium]|nr:hypothetical protein [Muribaculaceae bacterium]